MADLNALDAVGAYAKALQKTVGSGLEGRETVGGPSFSDFITQAIEGATEASARAEKVTAQAIVGQADLVDVVTAITNAELVVETVVAVRDRVIQAYNDILRMPM